MYIRTTWARATRPHTRMEVTGGGRLLAHDPEGDVLYGTEIMVHPDARGRGLGRLMLGRRFSYVVENRVRAFVTGGRLPGYAEKAAAWKCRDYVRAVVRGDLADPVVTAQLRWGLTPIGVLCGYMMDPPSLHHATLVCWANPGHPHGLDEEISTLSRSLSSR